ncbi:MAG: L-threonine 3-dehydrogenase, partial [Armatimonadota bacterium]
MNAIVKSTPAAGALWTTRPMPVAGVGELLVRIDAVSLCGTDLHVYNWDAWSAGRVKPPIIMGHEWAGEVLELGPNTTGFVPGDRVS